MFWKAMQRRHAILIWGAGLPLVALVHFPVHAGPLHRLTFARPHPRPGRRRASLFPQAACIA